MEADRREEAIARAFVAARGSGEVLSDYPGPMPETLEEGYRIQAHAIALKGQAIAGWKVGRVPSPLVPRHGVDRFAGPIFADGLVAPAEGAVPAMPVHGGFAAAEAEFLLRLASVPDPASGPWTNAQAARHIDAIHVGIEIAGSPFPGINDHGPAVTVSDFGNNTALVIGPAIPLDGDMLNWRVELCIDGETIGTGIAADMLDGPFGAVRFLFEQAAAGLVPLVPGQWVSTGAVTGVHPVRPGQSIEARFGDGHAVRCRIAG